MELKTKYLLLIIGILLLMVWFIPFNFSSEEIITLAGNSLNINKTHMDIRFFIESLDYDIAIIHSFNNLGFLCLRNPESKLRFYNFSYMRSAKIFEFELYNHLDCYSLDNSIEMDIFIYEADAKRGIVGKLISKESIKINLANEKISQSN